MRARLGRGGRKGSGRRRAISAPSSGTAAGEEPDQRVAGGVQEQLADQRADAEPAPDREAVEADHPAAPLGRRQVDDPGRAGGEDRALAGAEHEAGDDQAGDPAREQVEEPAASASSDPSRAGPSACGRGGRRGARRTAAAAAR